MRTEDIDLVVVGGGMAGCFAAMAAADRGNNVWLIEPSNVLGGQGTAGGVAGFCGDTAMVNQLFDELVDRLAAYDLIHELNPLHDRRDYELEWCAFFLQEMVVARGVTVLLHSRVLDASATDGTVTELSVSSAGEVFTLRPKYVIDATGLCLVPERAGFPVVHDGANKQLAMSLYFTLWDSGEKVKPILPDGVPQWTNDEEIPMTSLHQFPYGKVEVKMKVTGFDGVDGLSLSEAEIHARRQMVGLIYYLQTHGYRGVLLDRHVLAGVSRQIGIREQRRLVGEYVLTEEDVHHGCVFEDVVAVGDYHLDYHWTDRPQRDGTGIMTMVEPYQIPLRCMIPKGAKNVLVPGRGASAEQMALSSFRVMATVSQMGFAAGVAASHASRAGCAVGAVDLAAVQQDLEQAGQSLDLNQYGEYLRQIILTEETAAEAGAPVSRVGLERLEQGGFRLSWQTDGGAGSVDRREGRWQAPVAADRLPEARTKVSLDDEEQVRSIVENQQVKLQLSEDGGKTWSHSCQLGSGELPAVLVRTRRGVAAAFADTGHNLRFWHGSREHIIGTGVNHGRDQRL